MGNSCTCCIPLSKRSASISSPRAGGGRGEEGDNLDFRTSLIRHRHSRNEVNGHSGSGAAETRISVIGRGERAGRGHRVLQRGDGGVAEFGGMGAGDTKGDQLFVENLVRSLLRLIRSVIDNELEQPRAMWILNKLSESDNGWLKVVQTIINVIPVDDPLGPAVITLILDECPIPTKEAVTRLYEVLNLSSSLPSNSLVITWTAEELTYRRNVCVVLGCLAEKMAGQSAMLLLTPPVLQYLFNNLADSCPTSVSLFSVIALEKFAQTSEHRETIIQHLLSGGGRVVLESFVQHSAETKNFSKREMGFCAQWCLDNLFVLDDREYSYLSTDTSNINVMLNSRDVSEYLKISPDGLEARCDAPSFESVRCTFQVDEGCWYYEVLIVTCGVMQIGWATKDSKFLNYEGYGIGDDDHSISYDGCRQLIWYNADAESIKNTHDCWKPGDVLGVLLDVESREVIFSLNGRPLPPLSQLFITARGGGYFAAASFMSFQQCQFNFGSVPFRHPPSSSSSSISHAHFKRFNDYGHLSDDEKCILPRQVRLAQLRALSVREDACSLCADNKACITLRPCAHKGFCLSCALQLDICPMCREKILERQEDQPS